MSGPSRSAELGPPRSRPSTATRQALWGYFYIFSLIELKRTMLRNMCLILSLVGFKRARLRNVFSEGFKGHPRQQLPPPSQVPGLRPGVPREPKPTSTTAHTIYIYIYIYIYIFIYLFIYLFTYNIVCYRIPELL